MNVLSLFAGIGGLELGLEWAGMTTVGQVEIDPFCRRVLAKHWPEVSRHDDVRTAVDWWRGEPRPRVDVVCGGFPCQDISTANTAGPRAGLAGAKSGLWTAYAEVVEAVGPEWVVVENSPRGPEVRASGRGGRGVTDPRCGKVAGYHAHRKLQEPVCRVCLDAWAEYHHRRKIRVYVARGPLHVDSTGTRRRIHALMRMGWSQDSLAAHLGVTAPALRCWLTDRPVLRSTAERVSRLYDRLWDKPGPSPRTRRYAMTKRLPGPLAWDDDPGPGGIDDPAARPMHNLRGHEPGQPRDTDREEQVMRLTRAGLSAAEIAIRLRTNVRYVQRVRTRSRTEGAA